MTQILNGQFLLREAPAGNMVVVFIKTDIQPKLMNITTMIPSKRMLKRDLAIAYVPFRSGGGGVGYFFWDWGGTTKLSHFRTKYTISGFTCFVYYCEECLVT